MEVNILAKFGTKTHLEKMQKEGNIFCNTITYFSKLEDGNQRGDILESVFELKYIENTILYVKPKDEPDSEFMKLDVRNMLIKKSYAQPLGNLFCMSAFHLTATTNPNSFKFDHRFLNWGSNVLLIRRQDIFFEKIKMALSKLEYNCCYKLVEYLDLRKYTGSKTLFQKDLKYSWQEEWRLIIYTNKYDQLDPFSFSIGNIEDISSIYDLTKKNDFLYKV